MSEVKLGQLATAIDGEGSLSIIRYRKAKWVNYMAMICISNKSAEFLDYFSSYFPFQKRQFVRTKDKSGKVRTYYRIVMRNRLNVLGTLKLILPYLIIKKKHAELLIEFCNSREFHQGAYTNRELEIREEVFKMNIRGRGHLNKYLSIAKLKTGDI